MRCSTGAILNTQQRAIVFALCSIALLGGCGTAPTPTATQKHGGGHSESASGTPFDAQFIDGMIVHHQGAIDMAREAQTRAAKPEIKALADAIISAQTTEIGQLNAWRKAWYPDLRNTTGMSIDMGPMSVAKGEASYDLRFIDAMIPHHEGAIAMAKEAKAKAEHSELKTLSDAIIAAQTAEIDRMRAWRAQWSK
jgi:uncharacterized protein (DUF305 family)